MSDLKDRLDGPRREKGLTWDELASKAGVSRQTLYKAFDREDQGGHHNMDAKTVHGLARALGRSPEWVNVGEGPPTAVIDLRPMVYAVIDAVAEDFGIPKDQAAAIVGRYAFSPDRRHEWRGELDLYRLVMRQTESMRPPSSFPAPAVTGGVRRKLPKKG